MPRKIPAELVEIVNKINDRRLRGLVEGMLAKPFVSLREYRGKGIPFEVGPAGRSVHHCYEKGLIEHVVATTDVALKLCDVVEQVYGGKVDRDLVVAGVVLHDLFKPETYIEEGGEYKLSPLGERLDHLSLILCELYRKRAPIELLHVLAAHHGKVGPISPKMLEALIVHLADAADSALCREVLSAAKFLIKDATGEDARKLTAREALAVIRAKQKRGKPGVIEAYVEIKKKRETKSTTCASPRHLASPAP